MSASSRSRRRAEGATRMVTDRCREYPSSPPVPLSGYSWPDQPGRSGVGSSCACGGVPMTRALLRCRPRRIRSRPGAGPRAPTAGSAAGRRYRAAHQAYPWILSPRHLPSTPPLPASTTTSRWWRRRPPARRVSPSMSSRRAGSRWPFPTASSCARRAWMDVRSPWWKGPLARVVPRLTFCCRSWGGRRSAWRWRCPCPPRRGPRPSPSRPPRLRSHGPP